MDLITDRRTLLKGTASGLIALSVPSLIGGAAVASTPKLSMTPLRGRLNLLSGTGANVVVAESSDGGLLVDSGSEAGMKALHKLAEKKLRPVQAVFNTHWHVDHTGGNDPFGKKDVPIIAHENTRLWMSTVINDLARQDRTYQPRPMKARPTKTFHYGKQTLDFGGKPVEYGYLPLAHTDGDIYVRFPDENVLVAGDVVSLQQYPVLDYSTGGWIGGMVDALKKIVAMTDEQTIVVPGSGPVVSRADVQAQLEMCEAVKDMIVQNYKKSRDFDDLMAANPTQKFDKRWGDPKAFMTQAYRGVWYHLRDIRIF